MDWIALQRAIREGRRTDAPRQGESWLDVVACHPVGRQYTRLQLVQMRRLSRRTDAPGNPEHVPHRCAWCEGICIDDGSVAYCDVCQFPFHYATCHPAHLRCCRHYATQGRHWLDWPLKPMFLWWWDAPVPKPLYSNLVPLPMPEVLTGKPTRSSSTSCRTALWDLVLTDVLWNKVTECMRPREARVATAVCALASCPTPSMANHIMYVTKCIEEYNASDDENNVPHANRRIPRVAKENEQDKHERECTEELYYLLDLGGYTSVEDRDPATGLDVVTWYKPGETLLAEDEPVQNHFAILKQTHPDGDDQHYPRPLGADMKARQDTRGLEARKEATESLAKRYRSYPIPGFITIRYRDTEEIVEDDHIILAREELTVQVEPNPQQIHPIRV